MRQFIMTLPHEMDEAARIDGCGWFGVYWRIVLPLMKPAMIVIAIFTFLSTYNDFLMPVIFLNDPELYPVSIGLRQFGRMVMGLAPIQAVMAASTVVMLPTVVFFLFTQRYFMQGIVISGVKG
jgi:multiple sugar transport system permease protein